MTILTWMPDILADEFRGIRGFQVDVLSGWRTRSARTTTFRPIGILNHHTGLGGYAALLSYMSENSSISPLCHVATSRPHNGVVRITVVAAGRANHAGVGFLREVGTNGGNLHLIGNEHQNDGRQSWPNQQIEAIHRVSAAQLRYLKKNERWAWDHKDYAPRRKVDRHSVSLAEERQSISQYLMKEDDMSKVGDAFRTAWKWATDLGILNGRNPQGTVTREMHAQMAYNACTKRGDNDHLVSLYKRCLLAWRSDLKGFSSDSGEFGPSTEAAVKAYQRAGNLPETGIIDPQTAAGLVTWHPSR